VHTSQVIQAWGKILKGEQPSLSVEITRECPLKCPGCYAYDVAHLGGGQTLRDLNDRRGQSLVDGVLEVVDRLKPLHLSIVGGDPLVRYRELELLIPLLLARVIHVQIVTSAFRTMGPTWASLPHLHVVVSIDGLQPEHDVRRAPATYERILKNILDQRITVHCTVMRISAPESPGSNVQGMLIANAEAMLMRSAKPNPRANPATIAAVVSENTNGEAQYPVDATAVTNNATSHTTSMRLRTLPR